MKQSKNKKKKPKVKYVDISNTRMLLNQIAFSIVSWALGLLSIIFAIKFIHDGYILTPTDYRVESDVYFFSASPFTYLFYLLIYLGTGVYFLAVPYLFRDMFPRKKKKPNKSKKKHKRGNS
ncbi:MULTISPECIES: hypothetical protein [unclassified Pseudoalteromonas]|uniref:hypothetical protein n=1 Tax=unclassified Pseudoalteromonas TaxID=194690 RepID=UPI00056B776D|nr:MULTISPECIES: hypothetical protein [unclassified Pseudoalteromonas]|tara:strand:- start:2928 stop:3290 length:363 start_codon:yes stop_codon:yes gene_type:complete